MAVNLFDGSGHSGTQFKKAAGTGTKMNTPIEENPTTKRPFTSRTLYNGSVTLAAGKVLKIETLPLGDELLEIVVPADKSWRVKFRIEVCEV